MRPGYKGYQSAAKRLAPAVRYELPIAISLGWSTATIDMQDEEDGSLSVQLFTINKEEFNTSIVSPKGFIRQVEWATDGLFDLADFLIGFSKGYAVKRFGSYYRLETDNFDKLFSNYKDLLDYTKANNLKPSTLEIKRVRPNRNKQASIQLINSYRIQSEECR